MEFENVEELQWNNCEGKWKSLTSAYRRAVDRNNKSGNDRKECGCFLRAVGCLRISTDCEACQNVEQLWKWGFPEPKWRRNHKSPEWRTGRFPATQEEKETLSDTWKGTTGSVAGNIQARESGARGMPPAGSPRNAQWADALVGRLSPGFERHDQKVKVFRVLWLPELYTELSVTKIN